MDVVHITKYTDCGAKEIMILLKKNKIHNRRLKIMGVNTNACVSATAKRLKRYYDLSIDIIADACWSRHGKRAHNFALNEMYNMGIKIKSINSTDFKEF